MSPIFSKRYGFVGLGYSPPENIDPTGPGHQFSYTPPHREASDSSSESEDAEASDDDDDFEAEVESRSEISAPLKKTSIHVLHVDDQTDIQVQEMSENDMGYDTDTEAVQPDYIEDADSEIDRQCTPEVEHTLADQLGDLNCLDSPARREFEQTQQSLLEQKKLKRRSKTGSKKRSHSAGLESGDDDSEPLYANQVGSSARRLRRKTLDGKPRASLLFDDPPREVEELKSLSDDSDNTDHEGIEPTSRNRTNADLENDQHVDAATSILPADEEDSSAPCLYPMEVDSDPSRPSSSLSNVRRR